MRFPWQLGLSAAVWGVFSIVLLVAGLSGSTESADQQSVDQIQGSLGDAANISSDQGGSGHPAVLLLLGVLTIAMTMFLLNGRGWARYALPALALLAMAVLAIDHRWQTNAAFAALILGSAPSMAPAVHRYLANPAGLTPRR
jgi:hypothetical protein